MKRLLLVAAIACLAMPLTACEDDGPVYNVDENLSSGRVVCWDGSTVADNQVCPARPENTNEENTRNP